jgi:hypothetical protein
VNASARVLTIAVDYGIGKGFMEGQLDVDLASVRIPKVQNELHELMHIRGDARDLTWKRLAQLNEGSGMTISGQERERLRLSHS